VLRGLSATERGLAPSVLAFVRCLTTPPCVRQKEGDGQMCHEETCFRFLGYVLESCLAQTAIAGQSGQSSQRPIP
jgi:hypothetical protein